jgi:peptide/nickel transport system permease protein
MAIWTRGFAVTRTVAPTSSRPSVDDRDTAPPPAVSAETAEITATRSRRRAGIPWRLLVPALPVLLAVLAAVLAPWLSPQSPTTGELAARLRPPFWQEGGSLQRVLGSDLLGRDVLSRLLWGARISLLIAIAATVLGAAVGSLIGLLAGYYRGPLDGTVTKLIDVQLAFPFVLFAISVIAVAGPSVMVLVVVLAIGSWVGHARIVRGLVLSLREREYVQAARALGAAGPRIVGRHLLPNVLSVILIIATFDVGRIIILESTLSFLGLGVQPPTPSWGSDLRDAAVYIRRAWWTATFPGLAIMLVVLGVNLLGDALRDALDPQTVRASRPGG